MGTYHENFIPQSHGIKSFATGDLFEGESDVDMFNDVCGIYPKYNRCWIDLKDLGYSNKGIIWVVFMDGTPHGPSKKYLWVNRISPDKITIEEEYVGINKYSVKKCVDEDEIRLCFQRDPLGTGEGNLCKFAGVFQISEYRDTEQGFIRVYKKISEIYPF